MFGKNREFLCMGEKIFKRSDSLFSLCGRNCSLCPLFVRGNCVGCQKGSHCALVCQFVPCSLEHGGVNYCFECEQYLCDKYDGVDGEDSLISHLNQLKDMKKAQNIGIEKYHEEQIIKVGILKRFLDSYDNGHQDIFFCLAVNLMEIDDLNEVLKQADNLCENISFSERLTCVKRLLNDCASKRGITLKLRNGNW